MKARTCLLLSTPILLFLGSSTAPKDEITFGPESGSSVSKTFETSASFDLDDFSAVVDGQDMGEMLGTFEMSIESNNGVQVTDTYDAVEDGEVAQLTRTFDALSGDSLVTVDSQMGSDETTTDLESDLEGLSVVFKKGADGYEASFADGSDGDSDLLDGLKEEMDLRFLLPEGSVDAGDTWNVEIADLSSLLMPGGDLSFSTEDMEDTEGMEDMINEIKDQFSDDLKNLLDGSCTCTFKGMREEDGVQLAEISFEVEVSSAVDLIDMIEKVLQIAQDEGGQDIPVSFDQADLNLDATGEGTLLWNVAAGHAQSLSMTSEGSFAVDLALSIDAQGESHSGEVSLELSMSTEHTVTFE